MKKPIIVHEAMMYKCEKCGSEWWMFVEIGLEQPGPDHKPTPFTVMCPVCKRVWPWIFRGQWIYRVG